MLLVSVLLSYVLRCSIGKCHPSASSLQTASQGRGGTLLARLWCSVALQLCQGGTGCKTGVRMSRGLCAGTSVAWLVADEPRTEMP